MIKLISYGDCLKKGEYKIHSRFSNVVNFISTKKIKSPKPHPIIVSVVKKNIGQGPFNIIIGNTNLESVRFLKIYKDSIQINKEILPLKVGQKFSSKIEISKKNYNLFYSNLNFIKKILTQTAKPNSIHYLLDKNKKKDFCSPFEIQMMNKFLTGIELLKDGQILKGIKKFKGLGIGLTPSGDDFICGLLISLKTIEIIHKIKLKSMIEDIYRISIGKNDLSNTLLYSASKGRLTEKIKIFLNSLFQNNKELVIKSLEKVVGTGETSGVDFLVGFIWGFQLSI